MPSRPDHSCANGGCRNVAPAGKAYCPPCAAIRDAAPRIKDRSIQRLYDSRRWRDLSPLLRSKNPLCQFLSDTGAQCQHASTVVHHLVDPKDNALLFFDWNNLVAVCTEHHQGGQRGETQGYHYCHTIGPLDTIYAHGYLFPFWHEKYVPQRDEFVVHSTTSSVGSAAILKALQEPI